MDIELKEYFDSIKDELMLVHKIGEHAEEINRFVSIVCKNDKNFVDYVRYIHESKRESILFKNVASRHLASFSNEVYIKYYEIITDTKSELYKKVNEGYLNK